MKILIITAGYFPGKKYGGPPVSIKNICQNLSDIEFYIVCLNHDLGEKEPYLNIISGWNVNFNEHVMYLSDKNFNFKTFKKIIKEINPDFIYLQSLFQKVTIPVLILAKKLNLKVILAPRGELCEGAFKKKYKKVPYIILLKFLNLLKNVRFQSTSDEESQMIQKYLNVKPKNIFLVTNLPSLPSNSIEKPKKRKGAISIVFLSRIVSKKNLLFALEVLYSLKGNISFDIYGPIEDQKYWEDCLAVANSLPQNIKVEYKGLITHDTVHTILSNYDVFLFPTMSENYGHVISEALSAQCIPVISDQTPWCDINENEIGRSISLDNKKEYSSFLQSLIDMEGKDFQKIQNKIPQYLNKKLDLDNLIIKYHRLFKR